MNDDGFPGCMGMVITFLFGMVVGGCIDSQITVPREHKAAIDAHAGYWEANQETGKAEFKYGTKPEEKPR